MLRSKCSTEQKTHFVPKGTCPPAVVRNMSPPFSLQLMILFFSLIVNHFPLFPNLADVQRLVPGIAGKRGQRVRAGSGGGHCCSLVVNPLTSRLPVKTNDTAALLIKTHTLLIHNLHILPLTTDLLSASRESCCCYC